MRKIKNRFISYDEAISFLQNYDNDENKISKSKLITFEKTIEKALGYNIFNSNNVQCKDLDYIKTMYCRLYLYYSDHNLFSKLAKIDPDDYYDINSNQSMDSNLKIEFINSCITNITSNEYLNDLLGFKTIMMLTDAEKEFIDHLFLKYALTQNQNGIKSFSDISKLHGLNFNTIEDNLYSCSFSKKDFVFSLYFLLKFSIYRISNFVALEEQKRFVMEKIETFIQFNDNNYSTNNIVKNLFTFSTIEDLESKIRSTQQFIKDYYENFIKYCPFPITNMFESKDYLKLNFILILNNNSQNLNNRKSFRSIIRDICNKKKITFEETQFLMNEFNFGAIVEQLKKLHPNLTSNDIKIFFNKKFEIEKNENNRIHNNILKEFLN